MTVPAREQRRALIVLVVMQVIGTVGVGVAPSIGVLLAGEVTENEAWAGLARTSSTFGAALVGLPLGQLAGRRGRRVALATGWWAAASGAVLLVAAAQWSLVVPLFVGLFLIGIGSAVGLQARFAATDLAPPRHRARSLALVVWVGTLGSVLGPNLGFPGEIVSRATGLTVFASAFLITAACLATAGLVVFLWLRPDPLLVLRSATGTSSVAEGSTGTQRGRTREAVAELRGNRLARYALVAILTAQIVMVSVMTMTPVHVAHHGGSMNIVGITISLHVLGMYGLSPVVGIVADRFGHRVTIAIGIGIFAVSLLVGAVALDATGLIMVALTLLGLGWSFVNLGGSALFSGVVSADARASSQGGVDALANLCGATAAFVAGPLLVLSSFTALNLLAMVVLVPVTVLTATIGRLEPGGGARS